MMTQNKLSSLPLSFKMFLLGLATVFAVATIILIIASSSAATATGSAPSLAISLASEMNTGILGPGEQRWFKFRPPASVQAGQTEQSLTLFYTPNQGNLTGRVSLQLFEEKQLPLFDHNNAGQMINFGAGQSVSRDNNPNSGELFWTGWLFSDQGYYIQVENSSQVAIDYWLFTNDVASYPLDNEPQVVANVAPSPAPTVDGATPPMAVPLLFNQMGTSQNRGALAPGQESWYKFSLADSDGEFFEEVALTMFATPNEGSQAERLTFEIFTAEAVQTWSPSNLVNINNVGAGSLVQRDNDPLTTEHFWTGWVVDGDLYYVCIRNGSNVQVEYWLFTDDVYYPELGS